MDTVLTDSCKAVLNVIYRRDFKGTVDKKGLQGHSIRIRLLRGTIRMVITMGRRFCAEFLSVAQFTSEITSLGWLIIHLRVRKACKILKECFISSRHPHRNMTVQPLFTEHFDVKC